MEETIEVPDEPAGTDRERIRWTRGFGIATAVRDGATAVGVVLGLLYLLPVLGLAGAAPGWGRHLPQVAPITAGLDVRAGSSPRVLPLSLSLSPWASLGVVAAAAAAALLAGAVLLRLRDA